MSNSHGHHRQTLFRLDGHQWFCFAIHHGLAARREDDPARVHPIYLVAFCQAITGSRSSALMVTALGMFTQTRTLISSG